MVQDRTVDLVRVILQVLALGLLIFATLWVIRPFVVAVVWATAVAVATWPLLLWAQSWLGGRRSLAVAVMTLVLTLVLILPFYLVVGTIANNVEQVTLWSKKLAT